MMNNEREQQNGISEQGSQDVRPNSNGKRTKLWQFAYPLHAYSVNPVKTANIQPGEATSPVSNNKPETGADNMQPAWVSYQAPVNATMETRNAAWQDQARGGVVASAVVMNGPSAPAPVQMQAPLPMGQNRQIMPEEEEFDDPFAPSHSPFLALLGWPFRLLGVLFKPRRSMPALTQMAATECGAASLAMILSYYGHHISISEVSTHCGVGRDGLSASTIVKGARQYGLNAKAISVHDTDKFAELELPAIIHWQFNHFMVVERWTPNFVYVADPAVGRKKMPREEFDKGFTGIVILLEPSERFVRRRGASSNAIIGEYLQNSLKLAPGAMLQVLLGSFILLLFGLVMPGTTAVVINAIVPQSLTNVLPVFGLGMLMLVVSSTMLDYIRSVILIKLTARIDTHLMVSFFDHLLSLPLRYFQLRSSGDILTRLESNAVLRDIVNTQFISSILDTVSVVVYLAILLKASPLFALVTLFFGVIQVILMLSATKHMLTLLKSNLEAQGRSQGYLTEALVQISTLKAAGAEKHVRLRWLRLFFAEMSASVRSSYFGSFVAAVQNVLHSLAPLVLLLLGAQQVISGSMQLGTMMALLSLSSSFLGPLISLVSTGQRIQQAQAHLERIVDVMKAEPEQKPQEYMSTPTPRLTGHIHLANVGFQYDKNAKHVLHNINLTIKPGQKVAIVGRSGSGKSTLGKLLLGLYLPTEGEIYYDNIPLRSMNLSEVRSQLGVVMQDIGLFNGSIRENIAFNTPGIDLTAVVWAAQAAAIHDDIMKMPMDYETIVSEGGGGISGGQRQRLALARALVRNPAILLLDEATSSLDVTTERVVERNLNSLSCTQIIIAHRLSTIRNADVILAVDQGTIVEQGTHDELLKHNGFYARLIADQIALGAIQENK